MQILHLNSIEKTTFEFNVCFKKTMTHLLLYTVANVSSFFCETDVICNKNISLIQDSKHSFVQYNLCSICLDSFILTFLYIMRIGNYSQTWKFWIQLFTKWTIEEMYRISSWEKEANQMSDLTKHLKSVHEKKELDKETYWISSWKKETI